MIPAKRTPAHISKTPWGKSRKSRGLRHLDAAVIFGRTFPLQDSPAVTHVEEDTMNRWIWDHSILPEPTEKDPSSAEWQLYVHKRGKFLGTLNRSTSLQCLYDMGLRPFIIQNTGRAWDIMPAEEWVTTGIPLQELNGSGKKKLRRLADALQANDPDTQDYKQRFINQVEYESLACCVRVTDMVQESREKIALLVRSNFGTPLMDQGSPQVSTP